MTPHARLMLAHLRGKDIARIKDELYAAEGSIKDETERDALTEAIGGLVIAEAALKRAERLAQLQTVVGESSIRLVNSQNPEAIHK